jgi:hypothetical protein
MPNENTTTTKAIIRKSSLASKILIVMVIVFGGVALYFYSQYASLKTDPAKNTKAETDKLVSQVSRLIVLPVGEDPTVATVTDVEKLKDQPFFTNAKNGDKVLIYTQAKKAILFNPSANKIVEVAPINIGDTGKAKTSTTVKQPVVTPTPSTTPSGLNN